MKILIDKNGDALNSYTRNKLHQGPGVLVDAEVCQALSHFKF
jgi:hypothetical protein